MKHDPSCYYLGHPGHLIGVDGSHAGLDRSWRDTVTLHDGGLAPSWAFMGRARPARTWRIGLDMARVDEIAGLHELHASQSAPFMMVDPWAQVTNVLPVAASNLSGTGLPVVGGLDLADGGHASNGVRNDAATSTYPASIGAGMAPVLPGVPVTASAYIGAPWPCRVEVVWLDAAGGWTLGSVPGNNVTGIGRLQRATVTATPPAGAVGATVLLQFAQLAARPALTWTSGPTEWGIGGLAQQCVITGVADTIHNAVPDPSSTLRRQGVTFTVAEVGV